MQRAVFILNLAFCFLICASCLEAQQVVLTDDFEGGLGLWQTTSWGLSQEFSVSPTHSLTESPFGNYPHDTTLTIAMVTGANLTSYLGANLSFWARYEIEPAFDFCLVQVSRDGSYYLPIASLTGLNPFWQLLNYDLGAYAGLPDVRIRFAFHSDPQIAYDGLYLDDLTITGLPEDLSGPLIIHHGSPAFMGTPFSHPTHAEIWDASGVSAEHMLFRTDGGSFAEAPLDSLVGENYYHTIPAQGAGTFVEYYFTAADASPQMHASISDTFAYLAGQMLILDDGASENIFEALPGDFAAVRFATHNAGYVTSALIRIYTDSFHPLDSIGVYVWGDSLGFPGPILGGPFIVFPVSTPADPEAWTWVDLRPAEIPAPDTFCVGLQFAITGSVPNMTLSYDVPAFYRQSFMNIGSGWQQVFFSDFHIRCVVGSLNPPVVNPDDNPIQPDAPQIAIFPNPTNGMLKVSISGADNISSIRLFDLTGREIKGWPVGPATASSSLSIKLPNDLAAGIYLLAVGFEGGPRPMCLKLVYLP